jgi:hypothetical protein
MQALRCETHKYVRPKTRGELRRLLSDGIACEVVSTNAEITSILLRGWLDFDSFTIRKSENYGWSVFEAKKHNSIKI